jgi:single-strand DNA-binding protein
MSSINKILIMGNIGSDPELRYTPSGTPVCSFRVATNRYYNTPEGERKEETEWFSVVTWKKTAESCNQFLTKGQRVYVEGRIKTRNWESPDGLKHYKQEVIAQQVIFLDRKGNGQKPEDANEGKPDDDNDTEHIEPKDIPF